MTKASIIDRLQEYYKLFGWNDLLEVMRLGGNKLVDLKVRSKSHLLWLQHFSLCSEIEGFWSWNITKPNLSNRKCFETFHVPLQREAKMANQYSPMTTISTLEQIVAAIHRLASTIFAFIFLNMKIHFVLFCLRLHQLNLLLQWSEALLSWLH